MSAGDQTSSFQITARGDRVAVGSGTRSTTTFRYPQTFEGISGTYTFLTVELVNNNRVSNYEINVVGADGKRVAALDVESNIVSSPVESHQYWTVNYPGFKGSITVNNPGPWPMIVEMTEIATDTIYTFRSNNLTLTNVGPSIVFANLQRNTGTGAPIQPGTPDQAGPLLESTPGDPLLTMTGGKFPRCIRGAGTRGCDSPRIIVEAISSAQNQNFGEAFFTVLDSVPHAGTFNGENPIRIEKGHRYIVSQFSEFPQINGILKGKGTSLRQKFQSIIRHYHLYPDAGDSAIDAFTADMSLYVYSLYILSRLLYGEFSIGFLSRCFFGQFLRDLETSRYSEFSIIFTDPEIGLIGFNRYFRCLCKHRTSSEPQY